MTARAIAPTTVWRPKQQVCVKAIGLPFRDNKLLAAEVLDDAGNLKGVRPLGGHVNFGESWHQTIRREFQEELDVTVSVHTGPSIFENLYEHEGMMGHEIIFAARISLPEDELLSSIITFHEDNGATCTARWFDVDTLNAPPGPALFPAGLQEKLGELRL